MSTEVNNAPPVIAAPKRVHVNFAPQTYEMLRRIADRKGITISEALRQAISLTDYLEEATLERRAKLYVDRAGIVSELIIR